MIIGITGGYCAGKNMLCETLKELGIISIDVDIVGHAALQEKKETIVSHFGNIILTNDENIDRKKLGSIVFSHKKQLTILESIVHPWMQQYIHTFIQNNSNSHITINAALLFYLKLHIYCDTIVILKTPFFLRFFRALQRDSLGVTATLRRFMNQKPLPSHKVLNHTSHYAETKIVRNNKQIQSFVETIGRTIHGTV